MKIYLQVWRNGKDIHFGFQPGGKPPSPEDTACILVYDSNSDFLISFEKESDSKALLEKFQRAERDIYNKNEGRKPAVGLLSNVVEFFLRPRLSPLSDN